LRALLEQAIRTARKAQPISLQGFGEPPGTRRRLAWPAKSCRL